MRIVVKNILKISLIVALVFLFMAIVIWGLSMTIAVGNLHFQVKILEQRVNILSQDNGSRKHNGPVQDESP